MSSSTKDLNKTIALFYISKFLVGLRFFIPIWLLWGKHFLSLPQLAILDSAATALTVLADIPSGALADIFGRRKVIMIGWFFVAIGHAGQGLSLISLDYIVWGVIYTIASTFISGADTALIYDTLKEQDKQKEFTKIQSTGLFMYRIGIIISTFIGGLMFKVHPAMPYVLMGIAEFLSIFCWLKMKEPKIVKRKFSFENYISQMKDGIGQIFKSTYTKSLSVFYILIGGITLSSLYFFSYSYALDLGFDAVQQSIFFGFTGIAKALIVLVFAKYAHKFSKRQIYLSFFLMMILAYLPSMFLGKNMGILIISLTEILAIARFAFLDQFINDEFESQHRATALSFMNMMVNIVYLIVLSFGGFISNSHGTATLYSLFGVIIILTLTPSIIQLLRPSHYDLSIKK